MPLTRQASEDRGYHAPEVARVSVLLLKELLDALYGAPSRDLGRLSADLSYLIRRAEKSALETTRRLEGED